MCWRVASYTTPALTMGCLKDNGSVVGIVLRAMNATQKALAVLIVSGMAGLGAAILAGSIASAPSPTVVGAPPSELAVEPISIASASGSRLSGWFLRGRPHCGAILLMHGIRANRLEMVGRARLLNANGFSVLLFDFQAHGESSSRVLKNPSADTGMRI
jgi:hypothetical protein